MKTSSGEPEVELAVGKDDLSLELFEGDGDFTRERVRLGGTSRKSNHPDFSSAVCNGD
jgi:hypothetical protein